MRWFAEALYMDFGDVTTDGTAISGPFFVDFEHDINLTVLKAGVNYRF